MGQEKDDEISGSGNHTTAMFWEYDTRLGRRWNLDPKPNISISQYATFANNPIGLADINGDTVKIMYKDAEGNDQTELYTPGGTTDVDNEFVQNVYKGLNFILDNDADPTGTISDAVTSTMTVEIFENNEENNEFYDKINLSTYFRQVEGRNPYIIWDAYKGLKFETWTKDHYILNALWGEKGYRTPAEGLLHELGHFVSYQDNPKKHKADSEKPILNYYNQEEMDVIIDIENKAAEALGGIKRKHHGGEFYPVAGPTSTGLYIPR